MGLGKVAVVVGVLGLAGCGLDFDVPPGSHIEGTELLFVRTSVELGPLDPERVGPTFVGMEAAPIAEALPGDRVQVEMIVVDERGVPIAADELETLWVRCQNACQFPDPYVEYPALDVPCATVEGHSTSSNCRLGTGTGRFDFEVPLLDPFVVSLLHRPHIRLYGVVAWDGQDVEACWATRQAGRGGLDRCGYVFHDVVLGPYWWLLAYAIAEGLAPPLEQGELPELVSLQPANRIPLAPTLTVLVDGELVAAGLAPLPAIPIEPGAEIRIEYAFDPVTQSLQRRLAPLGPSYDAWKLVPERVYASTATSGALRRVGPDNLLEGDSAFHYRVEPDAGPGVSRALIVFGDSGLALNFVSLEFEVRP